MSQFGLLLMQPFLRPLALGYIRDNHCKKRRIASASGDEDCADVGPHYSPIFPQVTLLETINLSSPFLGLRFTGLCGSLILFIRDLSNRPTLEFGFGVAEHFLHSQVRRDVAAIWGNQRNAGG